MFTTPSLNIKALKKQANKQMTTYIPGDFTFLPIALGEREMLDDAYKAVSVSESWDAMKQEPSGGGFMFSEDAWISQINRHIKYDGHSGSSYGWTMRQMQFIALNGWDAYVARRLKAMPPPRFTPAPTPAPVNPSSQTSPEANPSQPTQIHST